MQKSIGYFDTQNFTLASKNMWLIWSKAEGYSLKSVAYSNEDYVSYALIKGDQEIISFINKEGVHCKSLNMFNTTVVAIDVARIYLSQTENC